MSGVDIDRQLRVVPCVFDHGVQQLLAPALRSRRRSSQTVEILDHRGRILEDTVGEDHDNTDARLVRDHLECPGQRQPRAGSRRNALLPIESQAHLIGLTILHLDELVVLLGFEELCLPQLRNAPNSGNVVPLGRIHANNLDIGVVLLEEPADTADGAAGAESGDEVGDHPRGLAPHLRSCGPVMSFRVGTVAILVEHHEAGLFHYLHGSSNGPLRRPRRGTQVIFEFFYLRPKQPQHRLLLHRDRAR